MMLEKLLNTFAPSQCLGCHREGSVLCASCLPSVFETMPSCCFACKKLTDNSRVCQSCRKNFPLGSVWVGTAYRGVAKQAIHELKFTPDRTTANLLATWLSETLSFIDADVVTFVPTARVRVRQRGYDHAQLLAKEFAHQRDLPMQQLLARHGVTRQVGSERKHRQKQMVGAYTAKQNLRGERVVIIDDIVTTGATLKETARVLKKAGAKQVDAIVFAQTI